MRVDLDISSTAYAKQRADKITIAGSWLRPTGKGYAFQRFQNYVDMDALSLVYERDSYGLGVRPALWLDLTKSVWKEV